MKKVGTFGTYFLYFLLFYLSVFPLIGVFLDPVDSNDSNLNISHSPASLENHTSTAIEQDSLYNAEQVISDIPPTENFEASESDEKALKPDFSEVFSQSTAIDKEIINNDTPIAVSHIDSAIKELQDGVPPFPTEDDVYDSVEVKQFNVTQQTLKEDNLNGSLLETENETYILKNLTEKNAEDIPSFSEWAQKHLEEAEKKEQTNFSAPNQIINTTKTGSGAKLRWKNYASVDCGAKVILANSEGKNSWALLSPSRDEYKLDPCNRRIWFIVELCEAIQLKKIDMANYELFSSSPKEFTVSVSDRFPTRDWSTVGQFVAKDERDVQSFDINTDTFGKYVKVEIKSHYGSEHYCPISLFRAYGTSVFEVLQKDDPAHEHPVEEEDDDDEVLDNALKGDGSSGNLLSSATDAVLSMVKKAAQVLGNKVTNDSSQLNNDTIPKMSVKKTCNSPSHYVVCNNCSDSLFGKIFELLSCRQKEISNLVRIPFIGEFLKHSDMCNQYGFDLRDKPNRDMLKTSGCIQSFFAPHYIGAMCNSLAVTYNKVLYNVSHQYLNSTDNMPQENALDNKPDLNTLSQIAEESTVSDQTLNYKPIESPTVEQQNVNSKSSCSTDTTYISQLQTSKTLATELHVNSEINASSVHIDELVEDVNTLEHPDPEILGGESGAAEANSEAILEADMATESSGEDNIEKMMTELNSEPTPTSTSTAATTVQGQKESVFLRLSNRIKALERNMSLSGQYLEELSKRYKKQVEEMQRVLEKTEHTLKKVTKKDEERHKQLEDKIESLTIAVEMLLTDRNSWKMTSCLLFFVVGAVFLIYCYNRYAALKSTTAGSPKHVTIQRRNSVDTAMGTNQKKKKRRPSDQALKIVATSASGDQEKTKRRRKKPSFQSDTVDTSDKFLPKCTSSRICLTKSSSVDWVEGRKVIEDIPFALDESDNSTLEPLALTHDVPVIVPPYLSTANSMRLGRSSFRKKSKSVEETRTRQSSPVSSITGSVSSYNEQTPKKEKKGFRKFFKKVF